MDSKELNRIADRLQSFWDRLAKDDRAGTVFEGDSATLEDAIRHFRYLAKAAPAPQAAQTSLPEDIRSDDALWRAGITAFRAALNEMTGRDGYVVMKTYDALRTHILANSPATSPAPAVVQMTDEEAKFNRKILMQFAEHNGFKAEWISVIPELPAFLEMYAAAIKGYFGKSLEVSQNDLDQVDGCMCVTQVEPEDAAAWDRIRAILSASGV